MRRITVIAGLSALFFASAACANGSDEPTPESDAALPTVSPTATALNVPTITTDAAPAPDGIQGTIVRFTAGDTQVDVTITADNPTSRDFLSMLPLTLAFEELNGREKIAYLPREPETAGSPGHDPVDGDFIYYAPWGNLGFYYNAEGIGFDDDVIQLGTYVASIEQLEQFEGRDATVEIIS